MVGRVRLPIDIKAVEDWMATNLPDIQIPLDVKQFGFGQSNPTYQLTSPSGARYVLRKKPAGKLVSKTAHKIEREYRVMAALAASDVPVPRAYGFCEDAGVIGTPFYIMSFVDGRIMQDAGLPDQSPDERAAMWKDAVRTLSKLHRLDPHAVGLGNLGRPSGFYNRQVATWKTVCAAQAIVQDVDTGVAVGALPHFDDMLAFFSDESLQPGGRGTLVHGDYKMDNLVFHPTEPRVIGVLDWEMATVGHPYSDLANLLNPWTTARLRPAVYPIVHPAFSPDATPGLPDPAELTWLYFETVAATARYRPSSAELRDRDRDLRWAQAFQLFRGAAVCQGIAARQATRQASSERAAVYADARRPLAKFAWEFLQGTRTIGGSIAGSKL